MADIKEAEITHQIADVTLTTTSETVILSSPRLTVPFHTCRALVVAWGQLTLGTGTRACTPRIRRGTTTAGALVGEANLETAKTPLREVFRGTVSVDPPSIATGATANVAVTVAGLTTAHLVMVQCQSDLEHGLIPIAAYPSAADTLTIRLTNYSAAAIDGVARTWQYVAYLPSASSEPFFIIVNEERAGEEAVQYCLTLQQTGATADGSCLQSAILVLIL